MSKKSAGKPKGADDAIAAGLDLHEIGGAELDREIEKLRALHKLPSSPEFQVLDPNTFDESFGWPEEYSDIADNEPIEFNPDLLPKVISDYACDEARRLEVPLGMIATPLFVAMGSILGTRYILRMKQKDRWSVGSWNFGMVTAPPSSKKSASIDAGMAPVHHLEKRADELNKEKRKEWNSRKQVLEIQRKALVEQIAQICKSGVKPGQSLDSSEQRLIDLDRQIQGESYEDLRLSFCDATPEKVIDMLASNGNGLLCRRDEMSAFFSNLNKSGREAERSMYLEAWTGASGFKLDRVGRGSTSVDRLVLSICGGIQPDVLGEFVRQSGAGAGNDGLLQRFQFMMISLRNSDPEFVDQEPDEKAREAINLTAEKLFNFDYERKRPEAEQFHFSKSAQAVCKEYCKRVLVRANESGSLSIESHLGKYPRLFGCVANILHQVEWASGHAQKSAEVSQATALAAVEICDYYEAHARIIYGQKGEAALSSAALRLASEIRKGRVRDQMSVRDIYRNNWRGLSQNSSVASAITELEAVGWCTLQVTRSQRGASTSVIRIHPALRK